MTTRAMPELARAVEALTAHLCYGFDGDEQLQNDPDEVILDWIDCSKGVEPFDDWAKRQSWPARVSVFRRLDPKKHADRKAGFVLELLLENLDEDYSDPDGNYTDPTEGMKAAAKAFVDAVLAEYKVWACEPTGEVVEYTRGEARKMWEGLEG